MLKENPLSEGARFLYEQIGFEPHEEQLPILACEKRFIVVSGGEQAGKSMTAARFAARKITEADPDLYWLVAADYDRTRAEFDYLIEHFGAMGVLKDATKRVDPGHIVLADGTRIDTKSAKDPRTLAMRAPKGIVICEASQVDLETFHKCRFRVGPKRGWLFLAGTLEGSLGWYPSIITEWQTGQDDRQSFRLPTWTNTHLYPGGRYDPEIVAMERDSSDERFLERIAGMPVPPRGLVFPEFSYDLHVSVEAEYVKGEPVHIWNDPGYAHANATLAAHIRDGQVIIFDEVYERGKITSDIIDIVRNRQWKPDIKFGVIDVGGMQHQAMAAPAEIWLAPPLEGLGLYMSYNKVKIEDGIQRFKSFLKIDPVTRRPRMVIHPRCVGLLSELGAAPSPFDGQTRVYRYKMDKEGNIVGDIPEDKNNDAVKAVTYGLWDNFGPVELASARRFAKVTRR
jgi:hypothetical protein